MKRGYPPAIIQKEDSLNHYQALDAAALAQDHAPITELVANAVKRSLDLYLGLLDTVKDTAGKPHAC